MKFKKKDYIDGLGCLSVRSPTHECAMASRQGSATTNRRHPSIGSISAFPYINFRPNTCNYPTTVSRLNISEPTPKSHNHQFVQRGGAL
jgi:hypothetical protein